MNNCIEYCSKNFEIHGLTRLREDSDYRARKQQDS